MQGCKQWKDCRTRRKITATSGEIRCEISTHNAAESRRNALQKALIVARSARKAEANERDGTHIWCLNSWVEAAPRGLVQS
eukprot:6201102-Pleurochrysis_carterae.AAC.2